VSTGWTSSHAAPERPTVLFAPVAPRAPQPPPARRGRRAGRTATLLSTSSDEAATSLLPAFLSSTLGASPIALGVIEGLASAADGVARLGGGALAEDPRRRSWISAGSFAVMAALTGLLAVAANSVQAGVLRAGSSTARGLRSPQRYASVPEHVGEDTYGRAFGFERCVHHLASVGGPLLAFAALTLVGVRPALLAAVVPGLVAVAIGVWLLRRRPVPRSSRPDRQPPRLQVRAVYSGRLGRLMTGITLFELANFAAVLLILRATRLLEQQDVLFGAAAMAVLLYMLWRLAASGSCLLGGRLVDRSGPAPVMAGGVLVLLAAYAGFAFLDGTVGELALCFLAAGAATGAIEAAEHVGVAQVAPVSLRWSAFGSLSAVRSFGRLTATVGATVVWTVLGPEWGLLLATPLMALAVVVMARGATDSAARPLWRIVRALALALLPAAVALLLIAAGGIRTYP
jgi:MFS family permease